MVEAREQDPWDGELERAVDDFLARAESEGRVGDFEGLPALHELEAPMAVGLEDFELGARLGSGAMGIVYEARQRTALGRRVAVKLLPPLSSGDGRKRFRREITAALALDHPGIVKVVAADVESDPPFLAMDLVRGASLDRILQTLREAPLRPSSTEVVRGVVAAASADVEHGDDTDGEEWPAGYDAWVARVGLQLASALQHAHDRGVVHRDVKPANVIITRRGRAVLLDFGVAALHFDETLTRTGEFVGTLHYCAPEQAAGGLVDGRADVYSLGATLYELLSLRRPHEAASPTELARKLVAADATRLERSVPRDLRHICARALARTPAQRYGSPAELARDLRAHLAGEPLSIRTRNPLRRVAATARRYRKSSLTLTFALALWGGLEVRDEVRAAAAADQGSLALEEARANSATLSDLTRDDLEWLAAMRAVNRIEYGDLEARRTVREAWVERFEDSWTRAKRELERALDRQPRHGRARARLADLHALRLERALLDCVDVLDPERLGAIEAELERFDDGRHAALLEGRGRLELDIWPAAKITLSPESGQPLVHGDPLVLPEVGELSLELAGGSYLCELERPGFAPARLPIFVRRAAADLEPGAAERRRLQVELVPEEQVPPGYVVVPGGWTLVEDAPPRWELVETFQVQRHEVTYAEWKEWFQSRGSLDPLPRYGDLPEQAHVQCDGPGSPAQLKSKFSRHEWPVRGLTPMELGAFAESQARPRVGDPAAWYSAVPTRAEWVRAARGADGRTYPWGEVFDWTRCGGFPSRGSASLEPSPFPVESFPSGRSPFGLSDLAGSMAELTSDTSLDRLGEYTVLGGSFRDRSRDAMAITTLRRVRNEPRSDVGLRVVRRRLPRWLREPVGGSSSFTEEFERANGPDPSPRWHAVHGDSLAALAGPGGSPLCRLEGGRLVCEGERGDFAEIGIVQRRISPGPRFLVRARVAVHVIDPALTPRAGLVISETVGPVTRAIALKVGHGTVSLTIGSDSEEYYLPGEFSADGVWIELRVDGARVEARAWAPGSERPEEPSRVGAWSGEVPDFAILSVLGPRRAGGTIEVERIELAPLE